jgi:hypothetical protein
MFAASKSGQQAVVVAPDPYFPYVPLLLETTSTNGQQNNTFLDSSTNNFTITRNGTPTQGSVTPYWPSGQWSNFFSSSYLSVADSSSLRFGSANFTIEAWVYRTASGATHTIACKGSSTGPTGWVFQVSSADKLVFIDTSTSITGTTSLAANTWYYVAVVRAGTGSSQTTLYLNGASDGTGTSATTFSQTDAMRIGTDRSAANGFAGYVSNLRLSNTNLTISSTPTTPLTALGSTIFLSCGYKSFIDGSSLASAITVGSGAPRVQAFQPFPPSASYTASAYGGSGYFNGSTDYLTTPANTAFAFGTGDFTVEAWIYTTARIGSGNYGSLITGAQVYGVSSDWILCLTSTGLLYFQIGSSSSGAYLSNASVPLNSWTHVAFSRASGTVKAFINGVDAGNSVTYSTSISNNSTPLSVGGPSNGSANGLMQGYISNLRIVKGTAVYTANFTPPTSPVTAITNTSLLTNFTNFGIYDAAVQNNAITVGDVQASTVQYRWSPSSIKFDGTGDWLIIPTTTIPALAGAFTIEMWVYFSSISSTNQTLCCKWDTNLFAWLLRASNAGVFFSYGNGVTFTATLSYATTLTSGTWYYLAITRNSSNSVQAYINGSAIGSAQTASGSLNSTANFAVGITPYLTELPLNGYLQDLRITNGVARTITTPTAAFPTR